MNVRQPDGTTVRQNLEAVERNTGKRPAALDGPQLPDAGRHIWDWYCDLNAARQSGFAANPISYQEMAAYFSLRRERPAQWELITLRRLDLLFLK